MSVVIYEEYHVYTKDKHFPDIYDSLENAIEGIQGLSEAVHIEKNVITKTTIGIFNIGMSIPKRDKKVIFENVTQKGNYRVVKNDE